MGLIPQDDWSGGTFRGRRAPGNAFYDLIGLLDDEGQPFRRGGSAYWSTSAVGAAIRGLADVNLTPGQRTVFWDSSNLYVLDGSFSPVTLSASYGGFLAPFQRLIGVGSFLVAATQQSGVVALGFYAGSLKAAAYSTGTIAQTNGSAVVTGTGTSFTANVDPGMILNSPSGGVVKSVDSNTQVTLRDPFTGTTYSGGAYALTPLSTTVVGIPTAAGAGFLPVAAVGVVPRLLVCVQNRVYFSAPGQPNVFATTDYHELPDSAWILGATSLENTAMLFTTAGVYAVANMQLDPFDDVGNLQHEVARVNADVILWGDSGLAAWAGGLVVPALEDVYVMSATGEVRSIGENIQPLLRSYVKAGYQPGTAAVHRGHYMLPVLNGTSVVDVLTCRLDRGAAWSRWSGHAAGGAYAQRVGPATRSPKLLGINGTRVTDLSGCFEPAAANKLDADGSTPPWSMTTRDYDLGPAIRKNAALKVRLEYELIDAASDNPTITGEVAVDAREDGTFTALVGAAPETSGSSSPYTFAVQRRGERVRFRFTASGPSADLRIKRLEVYTREAGF